MHAGEVSLVECPPRRLLGNRIQVKALKELIISREEAFEHLRLTTLLASLAICVATVGGEMDVYMYTTIQKWGNSQAVRLPKAVLEMVSLRENDKVEIKVEDGNLVIIPVKKHVTLKDRVSDYKGEYRCGEWDTGGPTGKEVI